MIELMPLPFKENALEPYVSARTVNIHYERHHQGYVDKLNELIAGTSFQDMDVEEIINAAYDNPEYQAVYNNAGQVFNHNVYWNSVGIWDRLDKETKDGILAVFGTTEALKTKLVDEAVKVFGSGWVWLVRNEQGGFEVMTTRNGDTPLPLGYGVLFNIDVWEHAYYLDYQNLRQKYVGDFISGVLKI